MLPSKKKGGEAVVAYFKLLPGGTERNHSKLKL